MKFEQLYEFRQLAYQYLGNAKDATFELADAVMTTRHVSCLGNFALSPLFRREWSSVYEAMQDCSPDREQLMQLYIQQMSEVERERIGDRSYSVVKTPCTYPERAHLRPSTHRFASRHTCWYRSGV
jgi:hypothetical protein